MLTVQLPQEAGLQEAGPQAHHQSPPPPPLPALGCGPGDQAPGAPPHETAAGQAPLAPANVAVPARHSSLPPGGHEPWARGTDTRTPQRPLVLVAGAIILMAEPAGT